MPSLKNAAPAPFIFFDCAPAMGAISGLIEIELAARALLPKDSQVAVDMICVAHLRCSVVAAQNLRDALDRALDMIEAQRNQAIVDGAPGAPGVTKQ